MTLILLLHMSPFFNTFNAKTGDNDAGHVQFACLTSSINAAGMAARALELTSVAGCLLLACRRRLLPSRPI